MIRILKLGDNRYAAQANFYSKRFYLACKQTPGVTWNPELRAWEGYPDCIATVRRKLRQLEMQVEGKVTRPSTADDAFLLPLSLSGLREYQKEAVRFLVQVAEAGAILGDDLGLGKTLTAIRFARSHKRRTLIVCPEGIRHVWENQLAQKKTKERPEGWPDAEIYHCRGVTPKPIPPTAKVVICNYHILYAWEAAILSWRPATLIIDEAHQLQSDRSRRSKSIRQVAAAAKRRVALTATPFTNRPRDLWNLVDTISPGRFGKAFPYLMRHCGAHQEQVTPTKVVWKFDGASNLDELRRRLKYFMIRRLKSEVALELPDFTRQIIPLDVKRGFRLNLNAAVRNDGQLRRALDMAADGKFDPVADLAAGHVAEGHQTIVFCYRRIAAEYIAKRLTGKGITVGVVHGGHSQKERLRRIAAKPDVLCCTMDAAGTGIDLSYCDVVVFAELHWVPSVLIQCEGRAHRFGQKRNVLVQYCIARGTADELVRRGVIVKLENFKQAIGNTDDGLLNKLSGDQKKQGAALLRDLAARLTAEIEGEAA